MISDETNLNVESIQVKPGNIQTVNVILDESLQSVPLKFYKMLLKSITHTGKVYSWSVGFRESLEVCLFLLKYLQSKPLRYVSSANPSLHLLGVSICAAGLFTWTFLWHAGPSFSLASHNTSNFWALWSPNIVKRLNVGTAYLYVKILRMTSSS